jgi:hypothetical protein
MALSIRARLSMIGGGLYYLRTRHTHIEPTSQGVGQILQEEGHRYDTENIQERGEKKGVKVHVAGWINWHAKCEKLELYDDEEEYTVKPRRPQKPRKRRAESEEQFAYRLLQWEADVGHEHQVKPKGNSMTQKYYCERLLPVYIKAIQDLSAGYPQNFIFQEDNDPSHGRKKNGLAYLLKEQAGIANLIHPPRSPDLNPMEACWNIIKQRIRRRIWHSLAELKEIIQDEWSKTTKLEVRDRIADMPGRCETPTKNGGMPIKTALWWYSVDKL